EGRGKVSIVRRDSRKPHPVACNDVLTVGLVYVEKKTQHIRIKVAGGTAAWKVAVVSGNHQSCSPARRCSPGRARCAAGGKLRASGPVGGHRPGRVVPVLPLTRRSTDGRSTVSTTTRS